MCSDVVVIVISVIFKYLSFVSIPVVCYTRENGSYINSSLMTSHPVQSYNACLPGYYRPESERQCFEGIMTCTYGKCVKLGNYVAKCTCDYGGEGFTCQNLCCRNCGVHGKCTKISEEEKCRCDLDYTGPQCDILDITRKSRS